MSETLLLMVVLLTLYAKLVYKNCASIFFETLAKEWQLKCKTSYLKPNQNLLSFTTLEISEMKQTKNWL
jgi:hypothetical protein